MIDHKSKDIFSIAAEYDLPFTPGEIALVTDDAFLGFREKISILVITKR